MKICWDNLEGLHLTRFGNFYNPIKNKSYKYIEKCKNCGESFLGESGKVNLFCDYSCKSNGKNHPMYGKKHTEETKEKMRKVREGKKMSEYQKQRVREGRVKRREKYGPNGMPEDFGDRVREGMRKSNPSGRECK